MRILLITDPATFNSDYRSYQPMGALSARGHEVRYNRADGPRFAEGDLAWADLVFVHRYTDGEVREFLRHAVNQGTAVAWDNDDDLTVVPRGSRYSVRAGGMTSQSRMRETATMVDLAHVVTTPSSVLAEQYLRAGARRVRVIENYVPDEFSSTRTGSNGGRIVVGWTAGGEHAFDLDTLDLRSTLIRLLDTHADLDIASVGLNLRLPADRYHHTPRTTLLELAPVIAGFDVGIAPIADAPFNRARSNVKVKEYAAVGVPWLASGLDPYAGLGERQGGRLVGDAEWGDAIERLICRARERKRLAKRAARWGRQQTISRNVDQWEAALEEARVRARQRV